MIEDELLKLYPLNRSVLERASAIQLACHPKIPLRTLDALHVATCDLHRSGTLATTDSRMRSACEQFAIALLPEKTEARECRPLRIYQSCQTKLNPTPPQTAGPDRRRLHRRARRSPMINVADEIKNSFLDYSMSVIISRALPDVRDGLKPSQRRILYAMHELSLFPGRKHYKCAKICGDTSGNYHPHGEAVIYPTLVHMAQPWAMRERLVDGKGNFGSIENDPPAAMRYTEARLTHLGAALMQDMDKDTVDFVPNYDERLTEPTVFPAAFPNLLVNGGTGIAVGMATNMPPHNLGEVVDGICAQIDKPDITIPELMKFIKGPDFPTGGMICGVEGIKNYFTTGKGSIKLRGRVGVGGDEGQPRAARHHGNSVQRQPRRRSKNRSPTWSTKRSSRKSPRCATSRTSTRRLVIELKRDANPKVVINNLYQHTQLEVSLQRQCAGD